MGRDASSRARAVATEYRGRPRTARSWAEVAAAPEDQRFGVVAAGLHFPDPADDDLVVAALELVLHGAFEGGDHPVEARAAGAAAAVPDPVPGGREAAAGEVGRQVLLAGAEHVHRERAVRGTDSRVRLDRSKQTRISGGSRDSELTALAVVPTGWPSASTEVTTVTPVAKWPIAWRKSAADTSVSLGSAPSAVGR